MVLVSALVVAFVQPTVKLSVSLAGRLNVIEAVQVYQGDLQLPGG